MAILVKKRLIRCEVRYNWELVTSGEGKMG